MSFRVTLLGLLSIAITVSSTAYGEVDTLVCASNVVAKARTLDPEYMLNEFARVEDEIKRTNAYQFLGELDQLSSDFLVAQPHRYGRILRELMALEMALAGPAIQSASTEQGHKTDIVYRKRGLNDVQKLAPYLKDKFDTFVGDVHSLGITSVLWRHGENNWHLERLGSGQFGADTYSVRLNHGYRVVFVVMTAEVIEILLIDKTTTHNN